ncbi:MAG: hypothetical protein M3R18_04210, partial [Pseudomonadota bacterium]|nr:hypothetical protein [Pseudomonadota bacterium]
RETIARLGNKETKGLILIANDNSHVIPPLQMLNVIAGVFARHFNSQPMDAFVYFTPNVPSVRFRGDYDWHFWLPGYRDDKDDALGDFVNHLGKNWQDHHNQISGVPSENVEVSDNMEELVREYSILQNVRLPR